MALRMENTTHNFGTLDERTYHCYDCGEPLENLEQNMLDELGPEDDAIFSIREKHDKGLTHVGFCTPCFVKIQPAAVIVS